MPFPILAVLLQLVIGVALTALAYLIMPRTKVAKPEVRDLDLPTADAGRPIPVVFGTETIKGVNILWYGEKTTRSYTVDA